MNRFAHMAAALAAGLIVLALLACNMVSTPASPPTTAPTPIVLAPSATPRPTATATLRPPTTVPPTQRPPASTAVLPATLPPPQPDPALCYFYPFGVNGPTITLYTGPGELNGLGPTLSVDQFITVTAMAGSWAKVRVASGLEGWIQSERGMMSGNCGSLPQQPAPPECRATAKSDTTVMNLPDYNSGLFDMQLVASASVRVIARSNGFWGFDPGVNWIPPDVTGTARLRWIAPGDTITLSGACDSLPQIPTSQECRATALSDTTVMVRPDYTSEPFVMKLIASASVAVVARSNGFWGFDPGVNWVPPEVTGTARLRWIPPGDTITLSGACDALPVINP